MTRVCSRWRRRGRVSRGVEAYAGGASRTRPVRRQLETMVLANPRIREVESRYEAIVRRWVGKMERLGLVVKGLWLVDFDTGDGYLCGAFGLKIGHYHGYHEGYDGRRPLRQIVEEFDRTGRAVNGIGWTCADEAVTFRCHSL